MTQPRSQQIKDPKTKFSLLSSTLSLGGSASQSFVGPSYTAFIGSTITGIIGGAAQSSPAALRGTTQGPFVLISGNQFSVTIPGVNGGLPITVTIAVGDIVLVGGAPRVTTSRLVNRINSTLAGFGVTYLAASNDQGFLRLVSAVGASLLVGDAAAVTLTDITPGVLNAIGFGFVATISASGVTAPVRGTVTVTPDGLGPYVSLRGLDGEPAVSRASALISLGPSGAIFVPDSPTGDKVMARLAGTGSTFTLNYLRQGYVPPRFISAQSDFSSLLTTDTITVTVADTDLGVSQIITSTFNPVVTNASDVVARINRDWNTFTSGAGAAHLRTRVSEPYSLPLTFGTLNFKLNGQPTISASIVGVTSAADIVTAINAAIVAAGQAAQGSASLTTPSSGEGQRFTIDSLNTTGSGSTIEILSTTSIDLLNAIGVSAGMYRGSSIARLYGLDEIEISAPFAGPNSSVTVAGAAPVLTNLGIVGGTVGSALGEHPYAPPTASLKAFIPEVMEFGEVPTEYETFTEEFGAPRDFPQTVPSRGNANAGLPVLLDLFGRVDPSFLPRILHFLGLDSLQLGADQTATILNVTVPRLSIPRDSTQGAGLLVAEMKDIAGIRETIRIYDIRDAVRGDELVVTRNALFDIGAVWLSDDNAAASGAVRIGKSNVILQHKAATALSWVDSAWDTPIVLDATKGAPLVQLGQGMTTLAAELLTARIETEGTTAPFYHLVWQSNAGPNAKQRLYAMPDGASGRILFTVNAVIDTAGIFNKDVPGMAATALELRDTDLTSSTRLAANNAPWSTWDQIEVKAALGALETYKTLVLAKGISTSNTVGDKTAPRLRADVPYNAGLSDTTKKTLLFQTVYVGTPVAPDTVVRIYLDEKPGDTSVSALTAGIVLNAVWNGTVWTQENAAVPSSMFSFGPLGLRIYQKASGAGPWADSAWTSTSTAVAPNTLTPGNIVKAWGAVGISNPGGLGTVIGAPSFNTDYGVTNYALDGSGNIVITLAGSHLTSYDFVMTFETNYAGVPAFRYNYLTHTVTKAASTVTVAVTMLKLPVGIAGAVNGETPFNLTGIEGDTGLVGNWILMARQT